MQKLFGFDFNHNDSPWDTAPPWAIELRELIISIKETIMVDFTKAQADIAAQTTVLQGVVVGVQALNASNTDLTAQVAALKAAVAANDPTAVQAALDNIDAGIQGNTTLVQNLIPAVTANTPTPPAAAAAAAAAAATPAA